MQKETTTVHELIKSMSKGEKAYFKKYAYKDSSSSGNLYFKLYDTLDKQEHYEEAKVLKKFNGTNIAKNYSAAKNYLYNLLLESLTAYEKGKHAEEKLMTALIEFRLLLRRGLVQHADKKLQTAIKLVEEEGLLMQGPEVMVRKFFLLPYTEEYFEEKEQLLDSYLNYSQQIEQIGTALRLYTEMVQVRNQIGVCRNANQRKLVKEKLQHPHLQSELESLTPAALRICRDIRHNYFVMLGDYDSLYEEAWIQTEPERSMELSNSTRHNSYYQTMTNLLHAMNYAGRWERFDEIARELRTKMPLFTPHHQERATAYLEGRILERMLMEGNYSKSLEQAQLLEPLLDKFDPTEPLQLLLRYYVGLAYFYANQFEEALNYFDALLDEDELPKHEDVYCFTRILQVLTHYELGNSLLTEGLLRSLYRYLLKKQRLFAIEDILIRFIRKTPQLQDKATRQQAWATLYKDIEAIEQQEFEKNAFLYFDFLHWLNAKR